MKKSITYDEIENALTGYTKLATFKKDYPKHNARAYYMGWAEDLFSHLSKYNRNHTVESIQTEALKYNHRSDFFNESIAEYKAAVKMNVLDIVCSHMIRKPLIRMTTSDFIIKAIALHGDRYDYSLVNYENSHKNITIICDIHGKFQQTPNTHLTSKGCSECGRLANWDGRRKWNTDTLKLEALKYKNKVDFKIHSAGAYSAAYDKDLLNNICKHMDYGGQGFNVNKPAQVYLYEIDGIYLGFGITSVPKQRHREHRRNLSGRDFKLINTYDFKDGNDALNIEKELYKIPKLSIDVEGFRRECVSLDLLNEVKTIISDYK